MLLIAYKEWLMVRQSKTLPSMTSLLFQKFRGLLIVISMDYMRYYAFLAPKIQVPY